MDPELFELERPDDTPRVSLPPRFKPLLAADVKDKSQIRFPLYASPKIDGIRCILFQGKCLTRSLKLVPNEHVRKVLGKYVQNYLLDGELTVGTNFQQTSSAVMSYDGRPDFLFRVFDILRTDPTIDYYTRLEHLNSVVLPDRTMLVTQTLVRTMPDLLALHEDNLRHGYEGTMLRSVDGGYKYGRSTMREHILLKLKTHADAEARVIAVKERMINANEPTRNKLGYQERSSHRSGMIPANDLGALVCQGLGDFEGITFDVGSGFTAQQRITFWSRREALIGKIVKFKYQDYGIKEKPRMPIFLGFRDWSDM
jgi:DNA ligase-1